MHTNKNIFSKQKIDIKRNGFFESVERNESESSISVKSIIQFSSTDTEYYNLAS